MCCRAPSSRRRCTLQWQAARPRSATPGVGAQRRRRARHTTGDGRRYSTQKLARVDTETSAASRRSTESSDAPRSYAASSGLTATTILWSLVLSIDSQLALHQPVFLVILPPPLRSSMTAANQQLSESSSSSAATRLPHHFSSHVSRGAAAPFVDGAPDGKTTAPSDTTAPLGPSQRWDPSVAAVGSGKTAQTTFQARRQPGGAQLATVPGAEPPT